VKTIPADLTPKLAETLRVFRAMTDANDGASPSMRALGDKLGISHGAAHLRVRQLRDAGYLTMPPVTQTRLRISEKGKKVS
jgi:DNA-binding MarR family transcriptional regulator